MRNMIDKFSTVYAGHVDLGDMGQQATPANERRYSNDHLASVFAKTEAIARCMDEHGYRTLWLAEHHFQHEGYECLPNILWSASIWRISRHASTPAAASTSRPCGTRSAWRRITRSPTF